MNSQTFKIAKRRTRLMRYACFGWLLLAFLAFGPSSTQAALVAHFKFENSLNDETGNHNG